MKRPDMSAAWIFCVLLCTAYYATRASNVPLQFNRWGVGGRLLKLYNVSVRQCVLECKTRPKCALFNYKRRIHECVLKKTLVHVETNPSESGVVFVPRADILTGDLQCGDSVCDGTFVCDVQNNSCVIRECEYPKISNGEVLGNVKSVGANVVFTCTGYYTLDSPNNQAQCLGNGTWSHEPTCVIDCGQPTFVTGADVSSGSSLLGDVRVYYCHTGYTATGSADMSVTCQSNATWSPALFQCLLDCSPPPTADYASVSPGYVVQGSIRTYTCDQGYSVTTNNPAMTVTCQASGTWTAVGFTCVPDCSTPSWVAHATVTTGTVTQGSVRTYTCKSGYSVSGTSTSITCQNDATWTAVQFICLQGVIGIVRLPAYNPDCSTPPSVADASVASGQLTQGSVRAYTCNSGYSVSGTSTSITCQIDASWSAVQFSCLQNCRAPPSMSNGYALSGSKVQGSQREYVCDSGHVGSGDPYITCLASATWSSLALTCTAQCGTPPSVSNAQVSNGGDLEGDVRTYTCTTGYGVPSDTNTDVTCRSSGTWSTVGFTCMQEGCVAGWQQIGGSCYFFGGISSSYEFSYAQTYCGAISGYVVELETSTENNELKTWIQGNYGSISWWIGLSDSASEGTHRWIRSGQVVGYWGWRDGEPENQGWDTNVVVWENNGWADIPGSGSGNSFVPVCERSLELVA